jgi:preprotein translocase subunit SecB
VTKVESDEARQLELSKQVIRQLSITDIRLSKLDAALKNAAPVLPLNTNASLVNTEFERPQGLVIYHLSYKFETTDGSGNSVWRVDFTLSLSFRPRSKAIKGESITDRALQAFGKQDILEIAHPYARELVHQMTARMRVPAFILEVLSPQD